MATIGQWVQGARLRTLPLAITPVIVGTAAAFEAREQFFWLHALLAALVALLLQIGVNYANDYSDGVRGTDDNRVGPLRLTGSGLAPARQVKAASFICFGLASAAGLALVILSQAWPLLLVGAAAVYAAWGYTGGKNPYGYQGLGELFVFLFFGLVATMGTTYTQIGAFGGPSVIGGISVGLIAAALLMANNVRDIPTDRRAGKRTLAVRLGDEWARAAYVLMLGLALLLPVLLSVELPWLLLVLLAAPLCLQPSWTMLRAYQRQDLIPVLKQTSAISVAYAALFAVGLGITVLLRNL